MRKFIQWVEADYTNSVLNTFRCTVSLMHDKLRIADGLAINFVPAILYTD